MKDTTDKQLEKLLSAQDLIREVYGQRARKNKPKSELDLAFKINTDVSSLINLIVAHEEKKEFKK